MAYRQAQHLYANVTPMDGGAAIERGVRVAGQAIAAVKGGTGIAKDLKLMDALEKWDKKWSSNGGEAAGQVAAESPQVESGHKTYTIEELMKMTGNRRQAFTL